MKLISKVELNLLIAIITLAISILGFIVTSFLLTTGYKDIPLGFLFSGGVIAILYIITHFFVRFDTREAKATWSILAISIRLVVIVALMVILAMMNYRWNIKLFNIFVFVGVYTVSTLTFILLHISKNRKE